MSAAEHASTRRMRQYWNAKARENALWYIDSDLDYVYPDQTEFWRSGADVLERTLGPFNLTFDGFERVLEVGCGIGRITRALAARAGSVVGVDVSDEMVDRARTTLADLTNVEVVLGNGRDLDGFEAASFDAVYSFVVFQHIPDPAVTCNYICEIGRVLRADGWAVFQISDAPPVHDGRSYRVSWRDRVRGVLGRAPHGTLKPQWLGSAVPRAMLDEALEAGGLDLVGIVGEGTQFCLVHARRRSCARTTRP